MKKIIKNPIFAFILGAILFSGITGVVAYTILAKDVSYTPNNTTWKVDNVEGALDDLYTRANTYKKLDTQTNANSNHILSGYTAYNSEGTLMQGGLLTYNGDTTITSTKTQQTLSTRGKYMTSDITIGAIPDYQTTIDNLENQLAYYQNSSSGRCISNVVVGDSNYASSTGKVIVDFIPSALMLYTLNESGSCYWYYNKTISTNTLIRVVLDSNGNILASDKLAFNERLAIRNNKLYLHDIVNTWIGTNIYYMACK